MLTVAMGGRREVPTSGNLDSTLDIALLTDGWSHSLAACGLSLTIDVLLRRRRDSPAITSLDRTLNDL